MAGSPLNSSAALGKLQALPAKRIASGLDGPELQEDCAARVSAAA